MCTYAYVCMYVYAGGEDLFEENRKCDFETDEKKRKIGAGLGRVLRRPMSTDRIKTYGAAEWAYLHYLLPSTMYTWTDNTDKNLKPNEANMTAFENLTLWFREFNSEKEASSIFKSYSLGILIVPLFSLIKISSTSLTFSYICYLLKNRVILHISSII